MSAEFAWPPGAVPPYPSAAPGPAPQGCMAVGDNIPVPPAVRAGAAHRWEVACGRTRRRPGGHGGGAGFFGAVILLFWLVKIIVIEKQVPMLVITRQSQIAAAPGCPGPAVCLFITTLPE